MKFIHVSDLHIGKSIHGISLLEEDQRAWIDRFLDLVREERPQAVLISGDVYDRANPSRDAIEAVDRLLTSLAGMECKPAVMMIAGNHDAGPMVEYLKGIAARQNIFVAGALGEKLEKVTLEDEHDPVDFWLLPYIFPANVNSVYNTELHGYEEALRFYLEKQDIDFTRRNVILSHQNITAQGKEAERGGSESMVGGVGGIDYHVFDGFEYAALGHIHAAQPVGRPGVRYAGSPLCYHFDEAKHPDKGPVVVTLSEKGEAPTIEIRKIEPLHLMREVRGTPEEIERQAEESKRKDEYIRAIITPDADGNSCFSPNTEARLRAAFEAKGSKLLDIRYEFAAKRLTEPRISSDYKEKPLGEQFTEFWGQRRDCAMDEDLLSILEIIAEQSEHADEWIKKDARGNLNKTEADNIAAIVNCAKKGKETEQ